MLGQLWTNTPAQFFILSNFHVLTAISIVILIQSILCDLQCFQKKKQKKKKKKPNTMN